MPISRRRVLLLAASAVIAVWIVAAAGYRLAIRSKVTSEKLQAYISSINFAALDREQRARAIADLAARINALSSDERMQMYAQRAWDGWFRQMTEDEKMSFVEATMPAGIKQMMAAFEQLPPAERKKTIDEAMRRLRSSQELPIPNNPARQRDPTRTTASRPLSAELEERIRAVGLKTFYVESSAQTKAEVAPLLEEMQRQMENGAVLR